MNFKLTSNILRSAWAIEPQTALSHGTLIHSLLEGKDILERITEKSKPVFLELSQNKQSNEKSSSNKVAVIPIKGELMKYDEPCEPAGMQTIGTWIKEADNNPEVDAIMLDIDSPGGTVDGTEALGDIVKNTKKPITAFVNGMMASAALWIGSNADKIIASTPNDQIGSIGVMISFADMKPYWEKQGIKFHSINADQSSDKNKILADALKGNYDSLKKEMLNPLASAFIDKVKENRPNVSDKHLTGKMFFAKEVVSTLIDDIGNFDYAVQETINLINNNNKNLKAMSENGQNIDERTFMQKVAETFGLKPVEKQRADEIEQLKSTLNDYESKMSDMLQKFESLAKEKQEAGEQLTSAIQELENLKIENERLKNLPGAPEIIEKNDTDGKADSDGKLYDPSKSFEENYQAIGKAFGLLS